MQKKIVFMLGMLLGIAGPVCTQMPWPFDPFPQPENKLFELPYFSIGMAWHFDMGKGNYMELELADRSQLARFRNIDSLLLVFVDDMKPFQDSLSDALSGKRIDYLIDTAGRKLMRIRETRPPGTTFLLGDQQPSLLRTKQDTIYITLLAPPSSPKSILPVRYNRLTVVINRVDQLEGLVTSGLNNKIKEVDPEAGHRYRYKDDYGGGGYLSIDPSVTIKKEGVYGSGRGRDYIEVIGVVGVQNYRNMFAPSVGFGDDLVFHHRYSIHTVSFLYDGFVLFTTDAQDHQQTYWNDYIAIGYSYDRMDPATLKPVGLFTNVSFGWFVHHEGGILPKNSYRITFGGLKLMNGRFIIEPGSFITGNTSSFFIRLAYRYL